jgi:2-polyprenyl-6-hydroxyphenyl methylase/3-demethylubiquinone-9 3-methyltransferase
MDKELDIRIWGQSVPANLLTEQEREYLGQFDPEQPPPIEKIWHEMDKAWDSLGLSSRSRPGEAQLANFYRHPVWILNGLFSASDPQSSAQREAIAKAVLDLAVCNIAEYGGGMGELAIRMSRVDANLHIDIIEPYPSDIGRYRISRYANVSYAPVLGNGYDLVIAQDVLEHLMDPVALVAQLSDATRVGGYLLFANCFYPVIKCHLPATFHLRNNFNWVVKAAGLEFVGNVAGADHAVIFRKIGNVDTIRLRRNELCSRSLSSAKAGIRWLAMRVRGLLTGRMDPKQQ